MPSNFNSTTPAAPAGFTNVVFQTDGNGNDSAYVPASSGGPGGSSGDIQFNNGAGGFGGSAATINTAGSITVPEGQVIEWAGGYGPYSTAAISALASDTLAIGDGSPGDVSGAAAMTALILFGSSSYYDYNLFHTTIYSGAEQNWSLILPPNPGTSGQVLTTNGSGVTYWETPSGGGGGGGSVTSFSSGNLSPLFTTSVATPTTTPVLSFSLNTQNANTVFAGPASGGAATPTFRALVSTDIPVPGSTGDILYNNGGVLGAALTTITAAGSITIPDTQVIQWTGSAYSGVGLSQLAADTLAVGNGTESDVSGAMAMTALILYGASYYSAYDAFHTTIYSGATQNWNLVLPETAGTNGQVLVNIGSGFTEWESPTAFGVAWSSLTNASANLNLANGTFTTTFNQTSNVAWLWANTSTGTSGSTNASPLLELAANYFTGSVSAQDLWTVGSSLAAGTNGASTLTFTHSGSTGVAAIELPANTSKVPSLQFGTSGLLGVGQGTATGDLGLYSNNSGIIQLFQGGVEYGFIENFNAGVLFEAQNATGTAAFVLGSGYNATQGIQICFGNTGAFTGPASGSLATLGITGNGTVSATWDPGTGSNGNYYGILSNPTINQSGSASGNFVALGSYPYVEAVTGTKTNNYLLGIGTASAGTISSSSFPTLTHLFTVNQLGHIGNCNADVQGSVSSAPTGIVATNVVVAVGAATATFTVSSTEGFTVGDIVTLSAGGWAGGSGLASTTATVASVSSTTSMVLTYVSGGPWVAGTYTAQTGTLTQTGGTSVSVIYAVAYTSTPTVVASPTSNCGTWYISASSNTGFTITYANSGTQTFNYMVMGNPN